MPQIAYITGTGTVFKDGTATGVTTGLIAANGGRKLISVTLVSAGGSSTAIVYDTNSGTGTTIAGKLTASTLSQESWNAGGGNMLNGIRVVPSGTVEAVMVVYE